VRLDGALPVLFFTKNGQLLRYLSALTGVPPHAAEPDSDTGISYCSLKICIMVPLQIAQ
jgi:hypothetical protein